MFKILKNIFINILDTIFPVFCIKCKERGAVMCDKCLSNTKTAERETGESIMALFDYRDPFIRGAIWDIKYYNKKHVGKFFGKILYENFLEEISELGQYTLGQKIIVVPVPISKKRSFSRGYNQSEIIARNFCEENRGILEFKKDLIYKIKDTLPQAKIKSRSDRLENIKGAFSIKDRDAVKGKTFIIIDDVTTTGGTIREIIKILKKAKAKKIIGLTVAH